MPLRIRNVCHRKLKSGMTQIAKQDPMVSRPRSGLALWLALPTLASPYILQFYTNREQGLLTAPQYTLLSKDSIDCVSAIHSETKVTYKISKSTGWTIKTTEFTKVTDIHAVPVIGWNINHHGIGPATVTATATSSFDTIFSTTTQAPIPRSKGISVGAKVGLGVGITMAIMGVMVGAFLVYLRIKRHAKKGIATQLRPWRYGREPSKFEVPLHSTGGIPQRPLAELSAIREPSEMEG
ncbi:hypothetical protein BDV38DRAFT_199247 [Aspergillus pseudotamarii]|uniref:Mid2 domain-containing protein n=1 Tax=Aspergillus pseudotamarii TaxID=132259 RepID=A0A5N6SGL7_ASPPS|nr:uncharacterized protein BDV38DRAFT_199247 [Aspergillus pseudotamarii]KAE8132880.1 hypothetical protein BDV38DRAFT_199247 [Aspergillus pseudotamarii]